MIHSTVRDEVKHPVFSGFRDIEDGYISPKARTLDYYLWLIEPYFDRFEIYSGEGERRQPYPYQWYAYSKVFDGYDDAYEGIGGSPLEAVRNLYHSIKHFEVDEQVITGSQNAPEGSRLTSKETQQ